MMSFARRVVDSRLLFALGVASAGLALLLSVIDARTDLARRDARDVTIVRTLDRLAETLDDAVAERAAEARRAERERAVLLRRIAHLEEQIDRLTSRG